MYIYSIKGNKVYFRVKSRMINSYDYISKSVILLQSEVVNESVIRNAIVKTVWFYDNLKFDVVKESNVNTYYIQKSTNSGKTWSSVDTISADNSSSYSSYVFRLFSKRPMYRVIAFFNDNTSSNPVIFN